MANSKEDVRTIVYEVFCFMFDKILAGEKDSTAYQNIAKETWKAWLMHWEDK